MELKDRVFEVGHSLSRKEAELENAERRCCYRRRRCCCCRRRRCCCCRRRRCCCCLALKLDRYRHLERELNETMRCCERLQEREAACEMQVLAGVSICAAQCG